MRRQELEKYLRSFEVLRGISVDYPEGMSKYLAPQLVLITGLVNINGTPHMFEADLNLNEFKTYDDVLRLAKALLTSFEKAEKNGS